MSERMNVRARLRELCTEQSGFGTGQIIVALIGFAIMVTAGVFTVSALVVWQQDDQARSDLEQIVQAQNTLSGAGDPYSDEFGEPGRTVTATGLSGGCYTALAHSSTGLVFYADSKSGTLDELTSDASTECIAESQVQTMLGELGVPSETIEARTAADRLEPVHNITAAPVAITTGGAGTWQLQWRASEGAAQYRVYSTSAGSEKLVATVPAASFPSYRFEADFGGGENFRIIAAAEGFKDSHPIDYGFTTLPKVLANGTFERGFTGWQAGRITGEGEGRHFVEDERSYAGTVTPAQHSGNASGAVAEARYGDAIRSEPFELSAGDDATISFDARLSSGSEWSVEFYDKDMKKLKNPSAFTVVAPHGGEGAWSYYGPTSAKQEHNLITAPAGATFARLVFVGSGATAEQAAQFDNIDVTYR